MVFPKNFTAKELRCKCGCGFGEKIEDYDLNLLTMIQKIRDKWGKPLIVSSGARCKQHSIDVSSTDTSTHCIDRSTGAAKCCAVDFNYFNNDVERNLFVNLIFDMHKNGELPELGGIGYRSYKNRCVHVDTYKAPDGHLRTW